MAIETVQAVRQAELQAAQVEKDSMLQKEEIISEAGRNAKILIASLTKQEMVRAEQAIADANQKSHEILEMAKLKAENEVLLMREMSQSKESAAINLILSTVLHNN